MPENMSLNRRYLNKLRCLTFNSFFLKTFVYATYEKSDSWAQNIKK